MLADTFSGAEDLYLLEQSFRYTYASPVRRLRHRLMVVPRAEHGRQYRFDHGLTVSGDPVHVEVTSDSFNNHVVDVRASTVAEYIEFDVWALMSHAEVASSLSCRPPLSTIGTYWHLRR